MVFTQRPKGFAFFNFSHEIFGIGVKLNFALNLKLQFLILASKIFGGQILKYAWQNSEFVAKLSVCIYNYFYSQQVKEGIHANYDP